MRKGLTGLSAVVLAGVLHLSAFAAADPFDTARWHIETKQNEEALALLDQRQFDVNLQTSEGYSLLHYAAGAGNLEMVRALLQRGADPTLKAATGTTPYQMAIGTMVQAEIRRAVTAWNAANGPGGAPGRPGQGPGPRPGQAPVAGTGAGTRGGNGMCAMVRAEQINDGRSVAMRPFLKAKDAVWYNHPDELEGLLDDCVQVDALDEFGWTLLHHAADRDRVEIARMLLNRGASRTLRNKDGQVPANLASSPEMRALLGAAPPVVRPAGRPQQKGDPTECQQKYQADSALASDFAGRSAAMRRWQQCLNTGLYW